MKLHILSCSVVFGLLAAVSAVQAGGLNEAKPGKRIPLEEATKKYPAPQGKGYPQGVMPDGATGSGTGIYQSPYSHNLYDCRTIPHGALVLDESVNKVFTRP